MNTVALFELAVPPEGPFDTALTNGLLLIAAAELPGEDFNEYGHTRSATSLLGLIERRGAGKDLVDVDRLRDGLDLTQSFRHGRADDEFAIIDGRHVAALKRLDDHCAVRVLDTARRARDVYGCLWDVLVEEAEAELPSDPKDRMEVPDPEVCDMCQRPTFLLAGWDLFGGLDSAGVCIACGHERDHAEAHELAVRRAVADAVAEPRA